MTQPPLDHALPPRPLRLATFDSHVIAYRTPFYRRLANEPDIDLHVHYYSRWGAEPYFDEQFGQLVEWGEGATGGFNATFLRNWSPRKNGFSFLTFVNPGIVRRLRREQYDAVLVYGYLHASDWIAAVAARLTKTPVLYRSESSLTYDRETPRPWYIRIFKRTVLYILFQHLVSRFLSIGTMNREFYLHYGVNPCLIYRVPYAVDNDYFSSEADRWRVDRASLRSDMGISSKALVFLFAAKMVAQKAPIELLRAYRDAGPPADSVLIMAGSGELLNEAKEFAQAHALPVIFPGFVNQSVLPRYYAAADVFVRADGIYQGDWGLTVNEAMAAGLALLASDKIGATIDLVADGENGIVLRFGDHRHLTQSITYLCENRSIVEGMGLSSRRRISNWSYAEGVAGLREALRSCVRRPPAGD